MTRRIKTDRRDVAALAEANRRGWYRVTHRTSAEQRETKQMLRTRRFLVQQRSGAVSLLRSLLRQSGYRLGTGSCATVPARVARLAVTGELATTLAPLCRQIAALTTEIHGLDARLQTRTASDAIVARLRSVPGIGLVVATTFRAFVDRHERFGHAGQVSAAIGLVPREDSSAERRLRGHITKAGPRELRSLLIQAAWVCWRHGGSGDVAGVGGPPRDAPWPPHRGGRLGAPAESHPVCALARRHDVRRDKTGNGLIAVAASGEATSRRVSAFCVVICEGRHGDCAARRCE